MKYKKGFTLVELLIAMFLIGIVAAAAISLIRIPTKANVMATKEFNVQSLMRSSSQLINNSVRDASALFLMTKSAPSDLKNDLSAKWDYLIAEEQDGISMVVHYKWIPNETGGGHHQRNILAKAEDEKTDFFINFETDAGGKLLKYEIIAKDLESNHREDKIESEIKPLNSFQITDNAKYDPATGRKLGNCLAFRNDAIDPEMNEKKGYDRITVTLVLDVSGSMSDNVDGWPYFDRRKSGYPPFVGESAVNDGKPKFFVDNRYARPAELKSDVLYEHWKEGKRSDKYTVIFKDQYNKSYYYHLKDSKPYVDEDRRISFLRSQAKALVDKLATSPNKERIEISLLPYNERMKGKHLKFTPLVDRKTNLLQKNTFHTFIDKLDAGGGTNTGDAVRHAYFNILDYEKKYKNQRIKHFLLVLSDGVPTYYSATKKESPGSESIYVKDKSTGNHIVGPGNYANNLTAGYMYLMGSWVGAFPFQPKDPKDSASSTAKLPDVSDYAENVESTVIGFSSVDADNAYCEGMGVELKASVKDGKHYIKAGSNADLAAAFSAFSDKILKKASLWYLVAPK